ncbi:response regulator [Treponema primitia]|uniref:response regulator n=1 Tax=Treponema primitia TaxID=88058 RepID=UPI00397F076B
MDSWLYSFVIVDDEPEIREGIRDTIPWEELGFSFAGACVNGFEALELAERIQIDAVMTDINMPFLDGLAFTDRLAVLSPATKVLIISGYDDFEYARKAVQLQVYEYIVKPVTPKELRAVLEKLKTTLDQERAERLNLEQIKKQLSESMPLMRERFLARLAEGKQRPADIPERIAALGLDLPVRGVAYQCLILDFVCPRKGERFDIDHLTQRHVLEQFLETGETGFLFQDREDRSVLLIWNSDRGHLYRESLKTAEALYRSLQSMGLKDTILGVGEPVDDPEDLLVSYNSAAEALIAAALRGISGVSAYREVMGKTGFSDEVFRRTRKREEGEPAWERRIASAIKTGGQDECLLCIDEMARHFQNTPFTVEEYHRKLALVLASIMQSCTSLEIPEQEIFLPGSDPFAEIIRLKNLGEVRAWFIDLVSRITTYIRARQENFAQIKVREALDYLESNYADPALSLQGLCKKLDISMSYFSAVLKRYHDKTFVEELTDIRLNRAMEMLRTTDLMTYEIAEKIGYRDAHYFSLSFRKYSGFTATEYRNRNRNESQA